MAQERDGFSARRSGRVVHEISTDNDIWQERLAVCEMQVAGGKQKRGEEYELQIRSFFESNLTGNRKWDEPPSGADEIIYATKNERKLAEDKITELKSHSAALRAGEADSIPKLKFGQRFAMIFKKKQDVENNCVDTKGTFDHDGDQTDINLQIALQQSSTRSTANDLEENVSNFEDDMALAKALSLSEANKQTNQRKDLSH